MFRLSLHRQHFSILFPEDQFNLLRKDLRRILLEPQGAVDVEVIHLITVDVSISPRQTSVRRLLRGPANGRPGDAQGPGRCQGSLKPASAEA